MRKYFIILILTTLLFGCRKGPGIGGKASISGKVVVKVMNKATLLQIDEHDAYNENVYIVFGSHNGYDDKKDSDPSGYYNFDYLLPGDYTVYVFSDDPDDTPCSSCPRAQIGVTNMITISSKKEQVTAPDIVIYQYK